MGSSAEFSHRTRKLALSRFSAEEFDFLVIGGGITGAATARDAVSRGLTVALVERTDFAAGTSSRSSKLIHGGLRYLQNMEFGLVFEALAERAHLLKTVPHMVRPLPFYFPVYKGDPNGRGVLALGLWLYDLLSLFRAPGFHKSLSRKKFLQHIPFLKEEGLLGGFRYYDASMWDDVLAVENLRDAVRQGAAVASYTEAVEPVREGERIRGFKVRDRESGKEITVRAKQVVICAGPWTDQVGESLSSEWKKWLSPSKGVHLIFDLKRLPMPGAMVMMHPKDGRISFVIPRPDLGAGVAIVGTTDSPSPADPAQASVEKNDVEYLLALLNRYFPELGLTASDILSAYVGVRPLVGENPGGSESEAQAGALQKVSREHHIGEGPGGTVLVAGGKYTTHRTMAAEVVERALKTWKKAANKGAAPAFPKQLGFARTKLPVNPAATDEALQEGRKKAEKEGITVPAELWDRYGAEALDVVAIDRELQAKSEGDPEGFPLLAAQLVYNIRFGLVLHLEDFWFRRVPLYAARKDHGLPWAERLAKVWADELDRDEAAMKQELQSLREAIERNSEWQRSLTPS